MPKVTVVIPNYNHARFLDQRIQSVLSQTYSDFEVLYLDDASTDNSSEVFAKYADEPRVRSIINQVNSGSPFPQWNRGVREAKGEYIWIAESDDYADPRLLEVLVSKLEQYPGVGIAYCQSQGVNEKGILQPNMEWWTADLDAQRWRSDFTNGGQDECSRFLVVKNTIPNASAVVFRKRVYEEVQGADESFSACGDWLVWAKMLLRSDIAFASEALNFFRQHSASVTSKSQRSLTEPLEGYRIIEYILQNADAPPQAMRSACLRMRGCWFDKIRIRQIASTWKKHIEIYRIARRVDRQISSRLVKQVVVSSLVGKLWKQSS